MVSFLDLLIKIENGKCIVGIFDKRENFHFSMDKKHTNSIIYHLICFTLQ